MTADEMDRDDEDVPEEAVRALTAAQRRAMESGHPVVLVRGDQLVRITTSGTTVLKQIHARESVDVRSSSASND